MPWMEILANQMKNLIDGTLIKDIWNSTRFLVGIVLYMVFILAFIAINSALISFLLFVLVNIVFIFLEYKFLSSNLYMSYLSFLPVVISSYFSPLLVNNYEKLSEKIRMRKFFSKFVWKNIVDLILARPDINLDWEKKEVTVFFADIKNFTTISEKLSPDAVVSMLNMIFKEVNEIIFSNNWTLDKYIWDAIMAFWWAPIINDEHAKSACIVALEFIKKIEEINENLKKDYDVNLTFRIWINSWDVIVWSIWTEDFADYTVIWDNVNLASRLESINKVYGTNIILTQNTLDLLDRDFLTRELDTIIVKWKSEPITIYELINYKQKYSVNNNIDKIIKNHNEWLSLYRKWKFHEAKELFELNKDSGDIVADLFLDRINYLLKNKKNNWSWVWEFVEK